jgi:esterase/lipase superfamily enzyme
MLGRAMWSAGCICFCAVWWWVVLGGDAEAAGLSDGVTQLIGWLIAGAVGAGGIHAVHRVKQGSAQDSTIHPPIAVPETASSIAKPQTAIEPLDIYKVWYATNRAMGSGSFTSELSERLRFGACRVAIPRSHKFGSLGSPLCTRVLQRITTGSSDALRIVQRSDWAIEDGPSGFVNSVRVSLPQKSDQILVYIHGYNVSFESAILRAAQIGFDLKAPGITAAFCWASKGSLEGYLADEDTITLSAQHLADFLSLLHANFPGRTINIMAHSMGNRALMDVLQHTDRYPGLSGAKFGQIFLAAPDIDARLFRQAATVYSRLSARTTLYVCSADRALAFSGRVRDDCRTGYCPPVTVVEGIDTIEASNVNLDMLGHSYYAEAASVLYDMAFLLQIDLPPVRRPSLIPSKSDDGAAYWRFRSTST